MAANDVSRRPNRYINTRLPAGTEGVFALACTECGVLVLDDQTHDLFHERMPG